MAGGLRGARERDILVEEILGSNQNGTTITNADVWVSLHSGNPGETGANEIASGNTNPGYARATATNWTIDQV